MSGTSTNDPDLFGPIVRWGGVGGGAICNSSTPAGPLLTPGMSHEITPFWVGWVVEKKNYG